VSRASGEHRDPVLPTASVAVPPERGPVAILPDPSTDSSDVFASAIAEAGGTIAPLSEATRGVVLLDPHGVEALSDALDRYPRVSWVQLPWAGVDSFASVLASYVERDTAPLFTSAKGAYSEPVAEHALALTLATLRSLPQKAVSTSWAGTKIGTSLYGRDVVIVGAGGIALELMRLLAPFEVRVTVVRRSASPVEGAARTVTAERVLEVLPDADVVVIAAASTPGSAKLIGSRELEAMKSDAVLVNVARGPLVDTDALVHALASGAISGAGLDVTDPEPLPRGHPLWDEPRCVITSHSADTPAMTQPLLAARIATNVRAFLGDGRFVGIVDPAAGY
jgi:phosphoglycerate dehydrogenase-like enzyme